MKRFIPRRPSAAMVVAVVAFVFALTGGAIAAKQISLGGLSDGAKNKTVGVGKLTYVNTTTTIPGTTGSNINVAVSAACPSGFKIIGGGIKVPEPATGANNDNIFIADSYPTTTGWAGRVDNYAGAAFPATATTTAICAKSRVVTGAPPSS